MAVALAVWSGSGKLFEVIHMLLWWFGPLNQLVPPLDFMGVSETASATGTPLVYLAATLDGSDRFGDEAMGAAGGRSLGLDHFTPRYSFLWLTLHPAERYPLRIAC